MANQSQDLVQPWLESKAPEYDPAWAWKQAMEKYTAPPPSEGLESRKERFRSFMQKFVRECSDKDVKHARFDGSTTWNEVQDHATAAFDEYTRQGRSWRHPFRSTGRIFGTVACRIEFLLKLVPSGDYLGVLCGGLSLVYDAARRRKEIRELIIKSFDSLSVHIKGSNSYIRMYAWNENLRMKTEEFYIAILEAIEGITKWLQKSYMGSTLKSFFNPSDYGKDLEEKLTTNIQEKADAFEDAVTLCLHDMTQMIHHNVLRVGQSVNGIALTVQETNSETLATAKASVVSAAQLLSLLDLDPPGSNGNAFVLAMERIQAERDYVLFFGRSLELCRQSGISFIMNNGQFQEWFKSMQSQVLVIHGMDLDFNPSEIVSPLSYMCALLAQNTTRLRHSYSLVHFCRLYTEPDHKSYSTNGLLRSLVSQLTLALVSTQQNPDLSFIGPMEVEAIRAKDIQSLCRLFEELLKRVGAGVIFCILDATSWLECEPHVADMHLVMQFLNSLVDAVGASQTGLVIKLLVTNSTTSQFSMDWFPKALELCIPSSSLLEGQGFNMLLLDLAS
ncbi:(dimethylallyl)adenosine tRNA methylthiotransferase [Fusarium sp. NRRL 52700]|nr:(dimethylallyl)adenosine tRNA methylthiotransferase [Fusarium sp. NRRL 52700]